jgi:hypothetical protein
VLKRPVEQFRFFFNEMPILLSAYQLDYRLSTFSKWLDMSLSALSVGENVFLESKVRGELCFLPEKRVNKRTASSSGLHVQSRVD